jgi:excisionase family DNA binding protein
MNGYLRQLEVAELLGVTKQRISNLIKAGRIKTTDIMGVRVISRAEFNRFKKSRQSLNGKRKK